MEEIEVIKTPRQYQLYYGGYTYKYIEDKYFESYTGIKLNPGEVTKIPFKKGYWLVDRNENCFLSTSPWVDGWFYPNPICKNIISYKQNLTLINIPEEGKLLSEKELENLFKF